MATEADIMLPDASTMFAAFYERQGDPFEVLRVSRLPRPVPGPGEVRVRVAVSGVNPSDCKHRSGWTGAAMTAARIIPHNDGAGVIDEVGPGVSTNRIGERVWIFEATGEGRTGGTAAQYTVVPAARAVRLPDTVGMNMGAMLGVPALTAHRCLFADGDIGGQTILVAGGLGAVGRCAVQLARWRGATVIATCGTAARAAQALDAGAHHAIIYRDPDARNQIATLAPGGVDRVIEVALAANIDMDVALASHGATIISYASSGNPADLPVLPARTMLAKALTLKWVHVYSMAESARETAVRDISQALEDGAFTTPPLRRFSLMDIAQAHATVGVQGSGTRVVVDIP